MFKKINSFRYIIVMATLAFGTKLHPVNTSNLIGTFQILPKELRQLSPLTGAVAWNKRVLERLYDHGHLTPGEPKDSTCPDFNEQLQTWLKSIQAISIREIVRILFNRPPGTVGQSDFRPSKTIAEKPQALIKNIAHNLATLFLYQTLEKELNGKNGAQRKKRLQSVLTLKKIGHVTNNAFYLACEDPIYPGHTVVEHALLGLLWVAANNDRALLKLYFKALQDSISKGIEKLEISLASPKTSQKKSATPIPALGLPTQEEQANAISSFTKKLNKLKNMVATFNPELFDLNTNFVLDDINQLQNKTTKEIVQDTALCEILTYAALTPQTRAPVLSLGEDLSFTMPNKGKVKGLRPCFEVEIRNLLNYYAFDPATYQYSAKRLEESLGGSVHPDLIAFYNKYTDPKLSDTKEARIAWAQIMTNLDNVAYLVTAELQPPKQTYASLYEGLERHHHIRLSDDIIDEQQKQELATLYLVIPEEKTYTHYELQATYRNFVLILDHFLQLNLFVGKNLAQELLRSDFTATYLPKVLEVLGAEKIETKFESKNYKNSENRSDIGIVSFFLPAFQVNAKFFLDRGHGDLKLINLNDEGLKQLDKLTQEEINHFPLAPYLVQSHTYEQTLINGWRDLISCFAHNAIGNDRLFADLARQNLDASWLALIEYEEVKSAQKFWVPYKEEILAHAIKNNLPGASGKGLNFINQIQKNPKCRHFPQQLWHALTQKNPALEQAAFEDACKNIEEKNKTNAYYQDPAVTFIINKFLGHNNKLSQAADIFLQKLLSEPDNDDTQSIYRNIFFAIQKRIKETKDLAFNSVKHLFEHAFTKTNNANTAGTVLTYIDWLLDSKDITPQEAAVFIKQTARHQGLDLYKERINLLSKCFQKGLSTKETACYLRTITYSKNELYELHSSYNKDSQRQDILKKYAELAKELLEKDSTLTWDNQFWKNIEKHTTYWDNQDLLTIKQKRTYIRQALVFGKNFLSAYLQKPKITLQRTK
ncbi:TPA: hypothetical protein DCW54_03380 [Candidatus Dependentiae bacterium]|nr:hypothetical protein [Candidatus Dependentiae bacterium]